MHAAGFRAAFLPAGKLHPRYTQYLGWSFVSTFLVSAETILSSHSMLSAVSVAATTTATAAVSVNYLGKDMFGQIGGLLLMNKIGRLSDTHPNKFNKHSMVIQQMSTIAECATPMLPIGAFLPVASVANAGKCVSFTLFGALNAKVITTLSEDGSNVGEIYSKVAITNTLASSLGMAAGLILATQIPSHTIRMAVAVPIGALRWYTYNKAISGLLEDEIDDAK